MAEEQPKTKTFEQSLAELEKIVNDVEEGKIPLEQSIDKYAQGMKLIQHCRGILQAAEKRIETINKDAAPPTEPPASEQ